MLRRGARARTAPPGGPRGRTSKIRGHEGGSPTSGRGSRVRPSLRRGGARPRTPPLRGGWEDGKRGFSRPRRVSRGRTSKIRGHEGGSPTSGRGSRVRPSLRRGRARPRTPPLRGGREDGKRGFSRPRRASRGRTSKIRGHEGGSPTSGRGSRVRPSLRRGGARPRTPPLRGGGRTGKGGFPVHEGRRGAGRRKYGVMRGGPRPPAGGPGSGPRSVAAGRDPEPPPRGPLRFRTCSFFFFFSDLFVFFFRDAIPYGSAGGATGSTRAVYYRGG